MTWLLGILLGGPGALAAPAPAADPAGAEAQAWIAEAVNAHGLRDPQGLVIRFLFRDVPYRLTLNGRHYVYSRTMRTRREDRLEGGTFTVLHDGRPFFSPPPGAEAWKRQLNSVAYFALLPRPLEDEAVIATSRGLTTLRGETYRTIDVRFREEGGGEDHEDVFRYWFDPESHELRYLAYTFQTSGGGVRIRAVRKRHELEGVLLYDYLNLGRDGRGHTLDAAIRDFEAGTLPEISTIDLEFLEVRRSTAPGQPDGGQP